MRYVVPAGSPVCRVMTQPRHPCGMSGRSQSELGTITRLYEKRLQTGVQYDTRLPQSAIDLTRDWANKTMIHYNMSNHSSNTPEQGNNESERDQQLHSSFSPLALAFQQNFLSSSSAPPQAGAPVVPTESLHPPLHHTISAAADNSADHLHSVLSSQFDSQPQTHSRNIDMSAHLNFAQNEGLPGLFSQPLQNLASMSHSAGQMSETFAMNMLSQSQSLQQNDGSDPPGMYGLHNRNLLNMNMNQTNQVNQGRRMSNSASDSISDYQQFFGDDSTPQNPTLTSSNSNMPAGLLGQQNSLGFQPGNLTSQIQNSLGFHNSVYLNSSQEAVLNSMHRQNALNNSWNQQQQQQQQQFEQPMLQQGVDAASPVASSVQLPPEIKWKGRGRSSTFPLKLHQMLVDLENQEGGADVASFLPHGRGFQIHKPKEFCK